MMMTVFVGDNVVIFGVLNELFPVYLKSISIIMNKGFAYPFNCSYFQAYINDDSLELQTLNDKQIQITPNRVS